MFYTYYNCYNLTGTPACGNSVKNMCSTYSNCHNLTGAPVCGNNVTDMSEAYSNCYNLTGAPVCGPNVVDLSYAYSNCYNLHGNMYVYSTKVNSTQSCFTNRNNARCLNIYVQQNSHTADAFMTPYIFNSWSYGWQSIGNGGYYWEYYNAYIYHVENVRHTYCSHCAQENGGLYLDHIENKETQTNSIVACEVPYALTDTSTLPEVNIISSDEAIISISNIIINADNISFTLNSHNIISNAQIELTIAQGALSQTRTFMVQVSAPEAYVVEDFDGANYGFIKNANGYYESTNAGINDSAAVCQIKIAADGVKTLYIDCINSGESGWDYGMLSTVDGYFTASQDFTSDDIFYSFYDNGSNDLYTVDYGVLTAGEHYIYIKYRKDSSAASGNDSLQFKVRYE